MQPPSIPELKSRLAAIEAQISTLKSSNKHPSSFCENNINATNNQTAELKGLLMSLRQEHASILQSIDRALHLVNSTHTDSVSQSPSASPRLLDRINAAIHSSPSRHNSSPLRPALEKSHITFDFLSELGKTQHSKDEWSVASEEYLKKYGLI